MGVFYDSGWAPLNELTEETVNPFKDLSFHETALAADPMNTFDSTLTPV